MGWKLMHAALHAQGISSTEKFVLIALADYANDKTGECWPSQRSVANLCGLSRKSVNESVSKLAKLGFVEIIPNDGYASTYRVNLTSADAPYGAKSTPKHEDLGPNGVSPTVTGGVTQSYRGVSPTVTQTENKNKEKNKESEQRTTEDSYIPTIGENSSVGMNLPAHVDQISLDWDEISKTAIRQLVSEGFSEAEAVARVKAELDEAKGHALLRARDGWKNLDGNVIKHPQLHTIGTLANLARKTKNLPPITRAELDEAVDTNQQVAEWLFCGEEVSRFWDFLLCRNFKNSQGQTISRWNLANTLRWYAELRDDLEDRRYRRFRFGA